MVAHLLFWGDRMNKIKKFTYPPIFSICFFAAGIILGLLLDSFLPSGDYAGLAYLFIFFFLWVFLLVPVYCVKYSKLIKNEKHRFLLAFYNPFVLSLIHGLPFFAWEEARLYVVAFLIWSTIWTVVPLIMRIPSLVSYEKTPEETTPNTNRLLQNKSAKIIALSFTFIYAFSLVFSRELLEMLILQNLLHFLPVATAILSIVFFFAPNKNFWWKKWVLPTAFLLNLIYNFVYFILSYGDISLISLGLTDSIFVIRFVCTMLCLATFAFMFAGTLFDFKYIGLLRYGALANTVFTLISLATVVFTPSHLPFSSLLKIFGKMLFYIGFFVLTTNKKSIQNQGE